MFETFFNETGYKKRAAAFLVIAVVTIAVPAAGELSHSSGGEGELGHPNDAGTVVEDGNCVEQSGEAGGGSLFENDPNFRLGDGPPTSELFSKMLIMVLVVIGLGVGAMYLSRKLGIRVRRSAGKEIQIMETAYLGPRKVVHLVKVGSKRLLIGSTNEQMTTLADVTGAFGDEDMEG